MRQLSTGCRAVDQHSVQFNDRHPKVLLRCTSSDSQSVQANWIPFFLYRGSPVRECEMWEYVVFLRLIFVTEISLCLRKMRAQFTILPVVDDQMCKLCYFRFAAHSVAVTRVDTMKRTAVRNCWFRECIEADQFCISVYLFTGCVCLNIDLIKSLSDLDCANGLCGYKLKTSHMQFVSIKLSTLLNYMIGKWPTWLCACAREKWIVNEKCKGAQPVQSPMGKLILCVWQNRNEQQCRIQIYTEIRETQGFNNMYLVLRKPIFLE